MRRLSLSKASSAETALGSAVLGGLWGIASLCALATAALLASPASASAATCPNEAIREAQGSTYLPDCRAYELVTPAAKQGQSVVGGALLDGDHALYVSSGSILESDIANGAGGMYLASRGPGGWSSKSTLFSLGTQVVAYNDDLTQEIIQDNAALDPADQDQIPGIGPFPQADVYSVTAAGPQLISTGSLGGNLGSFPSEFSGASGDGQSIAFRTFESLEPEDAGRTSGNQLYERRGTQTYVVGILPDNTVDSGGAVLGGEGSFGLAALSTGGQQNAISADGSRIFFESPDPETSGNTQLYLRQDRSTTTWVSQPQTANPPQAVRFQGATPSGNQVFFTTVGQLTPDDTDANVDLYRYDVAGGELTRLTAGQLNADAGRCIDGSTIGVCGVSALSADGNRVYFLATGQLAPNATLGRQNMYVYDAQANQVRLVAPGLSDNDAVALIQQGMRGLHPRVSISADGAHFVFQAETQLTPFDNTAPTPTACEDNQHPQGDHCVEVYRYDAASDVLSCVSCNAQNEPPLGNARLAGTFQPPLVTGDRPQRYGRSISDDGSVVFQSADKLVPADSNGKVDVYQWRDGELRLLSAGHGGDDSFLIGTSADGDTVSIASNDHLVPIDQDTNRDLYAVRVDGGLTSDLLPPAPMHCSGEGCQSGAPPAPPAAHAGTPALVGSGNENPRHKRCRHGKVRRGKRCVKRHHHHHHHHHHRRRHHRAAHQNRRASK